MCFLMFCLFVCHSLLFLSLPFLLSQDGVEVGPLYMILKRILRSKAGRVLLGVAEPKTNKGKHSKGGSSPASFLLKPTNLNEKK